MPFIATEIREIMGDANDYVHKGLSGGVAYILDETLDFAPRCNQARVGLETLEDSEEIKDLQELIQHHVTYTHSVKGQFVLDNWDVSVAQFIKVMPRHYKRVLQSIKMPLKQV